MKYYKLVSELLECYNFEFFENERHSCILLLKDKWNTKRVLKLIIPEIPFIFVFETCNVISKKKTVSIGMSNNNS